MYLSKDQILQAKDLPTEEVDVPEWKGKVRLKGMTAGDREALEQDITDAKGKVQTKNLRAKLLVRSIVNEKDEPIFTEADIEALNSRSSQIIDRLFVVAQRLNGMSEEEVENAKGNS